MANRNLPLSDRYPAVTAQGGMQDPAQGLGALFGGAVKPVPTNPIAAAADVQANQLQKAIPMFNQYVIPGSGGLQRFEAASTPEGLDELISQITSGDLFQSLVDERTEAVESQLAAGGLTRSGTAINDAAMIPTDVALGIEQLLTGRSGQLADLGFSGTENMADLTTRVGEAIASGILGVEAQRNAADAAKDTNRSNLLGSLISGGASIIGANLLGSDPRLKTNLQKVGKSGPLDIYKWDWKPETKGTIVENMPRVGVLSTQVKEHFPHLVKEFGGYDMVNYDGLYRELCH